MSGDADATDFGGAIPSGQVSFAAGQSTATITVEATGDLDVENDEAFTVTLSNANNATISQPTASSVIVNDDVSLSIQATNAVQAEGDNGTTAYTFTVTRTGDTDQATTVDWNVSGDVNAADFGGTLPGDTLTFAAGETSKTITLNVSGDLDVEGDEAFSVTLSNPSGNAQIGTGAASGLIVNDDADLSIAADSVSQAEGDNGTTAFTFTVTRTGDLTQATTADWSVSGDADATDFGGAIPSGQVSFAAGQSTATITVEATGDLDVENDEAFTVTLSNANNATISQPTASSVIVNDDVSLSIQATNAVQAEGDNGTTAYTFTVTRTGDTDQATTVDWNVSGDGERGGLRRDPAGRHPDLRRGARRARPSP